MKFRAERDTLINALATAARTVSKRPGSMPVLHGLHLNAADDRLTITASDLDRTLVTSIAVKVDTPDKCVIPAKLLVDTVRSLEPGVVTVELDDPTVSGSQEAEIVGGRTRFKINTVPAEEYPRLPEPLTGGITVSAGALDAALRQVLPAAARDDTRPILTGVLCAVENDHLRLVATDSYRLAVRDVPGVTVFDTAGDTALVPAETFAELLRLTDKGKTDITVAFGDRDVQFTVGEATLLSRLIDGEFPNYRGLIPQSYPFRFTVDKNGFTEAAKRVALMARDVTPVRCSFTQSGVEMIAIAQDVGNAHEEVDGTWNGPDLTVGFNPNYLLAGAEVCDGDTLHLDLLDGLKPAVLRGDGFVDYLYLLMPVRIS